MPDEPKGDPTHDIQESQQVAWRSLQPSAAKSLLGDPSNQNPIPTENTIAFDPPASLAPSPAEPAPTQTPSPAESTEE